MKPIRSNEELELAIMELQTKKNRQLEELKDHWEVTRHEIAPANLLKDGVKDAFKSPDFKSGLFKGILSLGAGFITRNVLLGPSTGIVGKLIGTVAQTGAASLAYNKSDVIRKKGLPILSNFLKKLKIDS